MNISDEDLVEEFKQRLEDKNRALSDLRAVTKNLETLNKKLQESEKLKTDFLSNIRNEINNPLTVMVALSEELSTMKSCEEERFRGIAGMLHKEALKLDFQIKNILTAAELESGENHLHVTKVNLQSLIDECLMTFAPIIQEKGIVVKKSVNSPLWVNTDSEKMTIALANLISNAIIFNKEGGTIDISVRDCDETFFCSVKDDGIGIAKDDQAVIFDRFKQLDTGMRKKYMGHGLGLSVAMAAINFMDGTITVESKAGKGSTFTITVPTRSEEETEGVSTEGTEFFFDEEQEF